MPNVNDLSPKLDVVRTEMENFLNRVSQNSFTRERARVDRMIFLINNYDLINRIYEVPFFLSADVLLVSFKKTCVVFNVLGSISGVG